ncbi:unnamed protein product [Staurois parvus]|uniref:Uncharacterized protein n=1 Tax=Staurois parvus TaxID=386267 RepID=A0ABN9CU43_9NEOB|nr:unnamed protein product [Staurois parvus]
MFDSVFSDPPLFLLSPIHLLIEQNRTLGASYTCSVSCELLESM